MTEAKTLSRDLGRRLADGPVICAEGYIFELERRGYVSAGPFVPEVVLENPDAVTQLHKEFARAGSDIMLAFTYYGHREKMRLVGKEALLEDLNRQAIRIARPVADAFGLLVAGDVCNTNIYRPDDPGSHKTVRAMFEEQVGWAADEGVDFIVAETFSHIGEALIALEVIRNAGLEAVMMLAIHRYPETRDGVSPAEACRRLEDGGAQVVGLNCMRGPATMLPLLGDIRKAVSCHVAALPVTYRTTEDFPSFQNLADPACKCIPDDRPFPTALDPLTCNRYELAEFAVKAFETGVRYLGVCCGGAPHHVRSMAEALGRTVPASKYSPDMSKHAFFGTAASLLKENIEFRDKL